MFNIVQWTNVTKWWYRGHTYKIVKIKGCVLFQNRKTKVCHKALHLIRNDNLSCITKSVLLTNSVLILSAKPYCYSSTTSQLFYLLNLITTAIHPSHHSHSFFTLLPSKQWCQWIKTSFARLYKSFLPQPMKLLFILSTKFKDEFSLYLWKPEPDRCSFQSNPNIRGWKNGFFLKKKLIHKSWNWPYIIWNAFWKYFSFVTVLSTTHETLMVFYFSWHSDGELQTDKCLPVNDILDVVMHTLVISSSVWLDVKCNLGTQRNTRFVAFHKSYYCCYNKDATVSTYRWP